MENNELSKLSNFNEWLEYGIKNGWASKDYCSTHDILPMTEEENKEFSDGADPCVYVIRLFETREDQMDAGEAWQE